MLDDDNVYGLCDAVEPTNEMMGGLRIEVSERLIEEEPLGAANQGTSDGNLLLLTPR